MASPQVLDVSQLHWGIHLMYLISLYSFFHELFFLLLTFQNLQRKMSFIRTHYGLRYRNCEWKPLGTFHSTLTRFFVQSSTLYLSSVFMLSLKSDFGYGFVCERTFFLCEIDLTRHHCDISVTILQPVDQCQSWIRLRDVENIVTQRDDPNNGCVGD